MTRGNNPSQENICPETREEAFRSLYKKYYKYVVFEAYEMVSDMKLAEDLVHNVFARLWSQMHIVAIPSLPAYLKQACRHEIINFQKREGRRLKRDNNYGRMISLQEEPKVYSLQIMEAIDNAMSYLSMQQRHAFELVYLEKQSYAQGAHIMGITHNSFKTHLRLAIKTIRKKLIHLREEAIQ